MSSTESAPTSTERLPPATALTIFLLERVAEDEAHARRRMIGRMAPIPDEMSMPDTPARVLADCEAKRNLCAVHTLLWEQAKAVDPKGEMVTTIRSMRSGIQLAIFEFAQVYEEHPDFRHEWRP